VENRFLNTHIQDAIQFERFVSDYDYFNKHLLSPLKLEIPEEIWERENSSPKNITKKHMFPHWKNWKPQETRSFREICGETMQKNGYRI
jgi:hypothetical protein